MKLHVFICASPLYPHDQQRDEALHVWYLDQHLAHFPESWVRFSVLQNGCVFPYRQINRFCNPFPKSLAYNWLFCDANCEEDYWLFLPEDCRIAEQGWAAIRLYMEQGKDCFALSRDPKAFVCRPGIFRTISSDLHMVCDINVLGKNISGGFRDGALLRRFWLEKLMCTVHQNFANSILDKINLQCGQRFIIGNYENRPDPNLEISLGRFV